jgi:hypothetical protein
MNLYEEISKLNFGKCIGIDALENHSIIIHIASLDESLRTYIHSIFGDFDDDICIIKVSNGYTALLCYSDFNVRNVPSLDWTKTIINGNVESRYFTSNQPMLHEKHTVVSPTHPDYEKWSDFSSRCRAYGLYDDPTKIGTYDRWMELLDSKNIIM